jgi:hypothetical protein
MGPTPAQKAFQHLCEDLDMGDIRLATFRASAAALGIPSEDVEEYAAEWAYANEHGPRESNDPDGPWAGGFAENH